MELRKTAARLEVARTSSSAEAQVATGAAVDVVEVEDGALLIVEAPQGIEVDNDEFGVLFELSHSLLFGCVVPGAVTPLSPR